MEDHGPIGSFCYEIILTATDSSGLKASTSVNLPVGSDTSPPSAPTGLTATAAGTTGIDLSWPASTDNVGVSRLPGRALPGRRLHQLRPDRHAHGHHLRRHRPVALDHIPLPGPGGRSLRQPRRLFDGRRGHHRRRSAHASGPGRSLGVQRGTRHHHRRCLGQRQLRHPHGRQLDDPGPLRQRSELQRRQQPGPGRGFDLARPDLGDDPLGLDPADGQPERLADHPPAPARRLLPERQQQRRAAPALGRRHPRRKHPVSERADGQPGQRLDLRGLHLRRRSPCGSTSTAPRSRAAPHPEPSRPPTARSGSAATAPTASTSRG